MSALKQRITDEMKTALLSGDRFRGELLRDLKAAILNEEVASMKRDVGLEDAEVEKVVAREVKKRQESAALYRQNDRSELAEVEERELAVLQEFLPEQLSQDELKKLVDEIIIQLEAAGIKQMGQVIGAAKAKVGNAADGALLAQIVKEKLQK